jgi:hypothetical protein
MSRVGLSVSHRWARNGWGWPFGPSTSDSATCFNPFVGSPATAAASLAERRPWLG